MNKNKIWYWTDLTIRSICGGFFMHRFSCFIYDISTNTYDILICCILIMFFGILLFDKIEQNEPNS